MFSGYGKSLTVCLIQQVIRSNLTCPPITDQVRKLKALEKENAQLKKLVADLSLDKAMLQRVASGNF